jgi:hypothetical protein
MSRDSLTSDSSDIFKLSSALASCCLCKVTAASRNIEPFQYVRTLIGEEQKLDVVPSPFVTVASLSPSSSNHFFSEIVVQPLSKDSLRAQVARATVVSKQFASIPAEEGLDTTLLKIEEKLSSEESKEAFGFGLVGAFGSHGRDEARGSDLVQSLKQLKERVPSLKYVIFPFSSTEEEQYKSLLGAFPSDELTIIAPFTKASEDARGHMVGVDFAEGPCISTLLEKIRPLTCPVFVDASNCDFGVDLAVAIKAAYVKVGSIQKSAGSINHWIEIHESSKQA